MKKNKGLAYAVWGIAFVLFNVLAFVIHTEKTATFWIAYAFTVFAFVVQIVIWNIAFKGTNSLKSKFLGIPLIWVGIAYSIIQLIAFAVFMALPQLENRIAIVVCSLILGVCAICLIGTNVGAGEIDRIDKKVKKKVFYIKSLQVDVEMLASEESNPETKTALAELAEKIRFSDPMSNEALAALEAQIAQKVNELKTAEDKAAIISVLDSLLTERNKKAKLLK